MRPSVCIVSPGHLASNPRAVKEADALHGAGYRVTVVAGGLTDFIRSFDEKILKSAPWSVVQVRGRSLPSRLLSWGTRRALRSGRLSASQVPLGVAIAAHSAQTSALARAACAVAADLYIAHYVAALPAAAAAARRHRAALGYDAEDFHAGEPDDVAGLVQAIEGAFLPRCSHVTAAAPLIADGYAELYGKRPITILNVFPLTDADDAPACVSDAGQGLSAYWFSQSIGLDRGLQSFMEAMARTRARITLHVRGADKHGYGDALRTLAHDLRIDDRFELLPMASPFEMVELARRYDIGLSLETDVSESRRRCLTNKIFTYLLAGRPVLMSDTPAQTALGRELGEAAAVVPLASPDVIAEQLDRWALSPRRLQAAAAAAGRLARSRYNWQVEQRAFLASVAEALGHRGKSSEPGY